MRNGFQQTARKPKPEPDKLPPHSPECESGIIGCIIRDPEVAFDRIEASLLNPDCFYEEKNREIFECCKMLRKRGVKIDSVSLSAELREWEIYEGVGGSEYLSKCESEIPSAHNIQYYLDFVQQKWRLRKIVQTCVEVADKAYQANADTDALIDEVERRIISIEKVEVQPTLNGKSLGASMMTDLEKRHDLQGRLSGLSTGFKLLDYMTEGLQAGEHTVIGARPSQGKTALGLTILWHNASQGVPCLFVSLEMSVEAIMRRMCSMHTKVPLKAIRKGSYTEEQIVKFGNFNILMGKTPITMYDGINGCNIREIASRVNRGVLKDGVKLVVVDYMQKIKPAERHEKRNYEVADVSGRLKALAHDNKIHIITLAQLNRENVKTGKTSDGRPPRLSDLADSGQIERDADTVGLIHREGSKTSLILAKQRDGETGIIPLYFNAEFVQFFGMEDDE